jgi:hypothetical protein
MTKETATTMSQTDTAIRDWALGAVVSPAGIVRRSGSVIMTPIAGAILLLFFWNMSALAYTKNGNGTISTNGGASDVQAAIDAGSAGNTVLIPAGTFNWTSRVIVRTDVSIQGAGLSSTIVVDYADTGGGSGNTLIAVSNPTPFACRISGITFNGNPATSGTGLLLQIGTPALVHDCSFTSNGGLLDQVRFIVNGGVIWNCGFYDNDGNEEAITFQNSNGSAGGVSADWTTPDTMGTADTSGKANTYVEDCTFTDMVLQAMDFSDNCRVVVRHNNFKDSSIVSHGLDSSPYGARQWEVYGNNFIFDTSGRSPAGNSYPLNMNWWFFVRGGTGVIWGNNMPDLVQQQLGTKASILLTVFNIRRTSAYIPCQTSHLALHQVGQGYKNGLVQDPVYIWGNVGGSLWENPGISDWEPDQCNNGLGSTQFIQKNRDYYIQAKPGYAPYPYPHPLRTGKESAPVPPAAPLNLRVEK